MVRRVLLEVVEGVPKPGLAEHLEGRTRHPPVHVDLAGLVANALADSALHLSTFQLSQVSHTRRREGRIANLVRELIEDVCHPAQVRSREDRVERFALFPVLLAIGRKQPRSKQQWEVAVCTQSASTPHRSKSDTYSEGVVCLG